MAKMLYKNETDQYISQHVQSPSIIFNIIYIY